LAEVKSELILGTVVMFAAAPGKKAKDGPLGGNSPFATALAATLGLPAKDGSSPENVFETMMSVADAVALTTGGVQEPWLKFDGQPQLLRRLAFAPVSRGSSAPFVPFIPKRTDPVTTDPFSGTFAGQSWENASGTAFRWCPPVEFWIGSSEAEKKAFARDGVTTDDETRRQVRLTQGFWLSQNEVTQGEWEGLMGTTLVDLAKQALKDDTLYTINGKQTTLRDFYGMKKDADPMSLVFIQSPSICMYLISWADAEAYCRKLTESERRAGKIPSGWHYYTLPTEAQR
jgi:formylglycine-generating enzyme required for sulfatase activity